MQMFGAAFITLHRRPRAWSPACVWSWRSCSLFWFPGWLEAGGVWQWRREQAEAVSCPRCHNADVSDREGTSADPGYSTPERTVECHVGKSGLHWSGDICIITGNKSDLKRRLWIFFFSLFSLWDYCIKIQQQTSECCFFSPCQAPLALFILNTLGPLVFLSEPLPHLFFLGSHDFLYTT